MSTAVLIRQTEVESATSATDLDLIKAAQRGHRGAFADLYRRHAPAVERILGSRTRNPHRAEDLTAEVFARALNKLHTFEPRGIEFSSWLLKIGLNLLIDQMRSASNKSEIAHDILPEPSVDDFGQDFLRALNGHVLRQTLDDMLPDHRRVLELRFLEDRTSEETAKVMGKTHGAVRILQFRAIGAMRRLLTSDGAAA